MNVIVSKFKEVLFSVLPIAILVVVLQLIISPNELSLVARFIIGSGLVVIGLTIFLLGVDIGITPLGSLTGPTLAKTNKLWIVLIGGLVLGFFISIAEPGLLVLAKQVNLVTDGDISRITILIVVSIGMAVMIAFGFFRILFNISLGKALVIIYIVIFVLALFTSPEFLGIAFDASGATTGILAVPFILSLSVGISKLKKDSKASEGDSFGLLALASSGAIISVMLLDIFSKKQDFTGSLELIDPNSSSIIGSFINHIPGTLFDSFIAILPLLVIFIGLQFVSFKLNRKELRKLLTGFAFSFFGLFIFLLGVNAGFMDVGASLGSKLALFNNKFYIIAIGFVIGFVTILAEPAVHVLTHQIEEVTSGHVKRSVVLVPLAIGVGIAIALSVVRLLVPGVNLWHFLLPGYIIALILLFFIPKLFVGIAFDAGGVSTGPITATFILAFIQGAANTSENANILVDGFGMIAMVAMMPIITLEILGLIFKIKSRKRGVEENYEES